MYLVSLSLSRQRSGTADTRVFSPVVCLAVVKKSMSYP
ncbi:MAG: hypothetical protein ACI809_001934, partial [Candidatus Azotimanducaceae bacterium]